MQLFKLKKHTRRVLICKRSLPVFAFLLASLMMVWPLLFAEQKEQFSLAISSGKKMSDAKVDMEDVRFFSQDKKKQPLFFPSIEKTSKYKTSSKWKFAKKPYKKRPKHLKENESVGDDEDPIKEAQERKKQYDDELREKILEGIYERGKAEPEKQNMDFFNVDVSKAYNTVRNRGRVPIKFVKNFKETEDYEKMPHKQYVEEPAPNKYFKCPSEKEERRMKYLKKNPDKRTEDDDEKFKLYVDF